MPLRSDWSGDRCPIARSLDVVGDPWALLVLRQALQGARRYEDFRRSLSVADNVLSRRLAHLVEAGLLRREPYRDGGRTRQEYRLTEAGAELLPVLNALAQWGERHRPHADPAVHMDVVHTACGAVTAGPDRCTACGAELAAGDVTWRKSWAGDTALVGV
ncbi:winged helix-turn-helix transcriptional regulator [Nakamurella leprariae]|uniref:Helix-turn-helix transcriptional regulator n=1 Tax=Nakamurella leprariae TaxID=2803911 RepID=A0A939C0Y7_9ACTN|nr:helix-turn-helix domain-containing protein [Nakamurella leprariae]MBM9469271.1 helix-turn-helix transcriptional regulator [Nakamurella leprariae]